MLHTDIFCQLLHYVYIFTGDSDIVGPYFTCSESLKSKFVYSCVLETVKLFHLHGLKTILIVCDGASVNLTTVKATHGHSIKKILSSLIKLEIIPDDDEQDPYEVSPYMINPFDPPHLIHWLICPTHQVYVYVSINSIIYVYLYYSLKI